MACLCYSSKCPSPSLCFILLAMVLIPMGFKECCAVLTTDLSYSHVSNCLPPDPDSHGSFTFAKWLLRFNYSLTLRVGLLLSLVSPASGFDLQSVLPSTTLTWLLWSLSTWWFMMCPFLIQGLEFIAVNYWHMLFVWLGLVVVCHAFS